MLSTVVALSLGMWKVAGSFPGLAIRVESEDRNRKWETYAGNCASTLALKPIVKVYQSLKQRVPVAPQNGD